MLQQTFVQTCSHCGSSVVITYQSRTGASGGWDDDAPEVWPDSNTFVCPVCWRHFKMVHREKRVGPRSLNLKEVYNFLLRL